MIKIQQLNKRLLNEYINSSNFGKGPHIPISQHRALSQIKNPKLDEQDIILLLAMNNEILVGYLGILPDVIQAKSGHNLKVGWLSCLWVAPQARGQNISTILITKSLELWKNNILSADYVPFTKKIYDKTKSFKNTPYVKIGVRLYLRSDLQTILPPKNDIFAFGKTPLQIIDYCLNSVLDIRFRFYDKNNSQLSIEYIDTIDQEVIDFISTKQGTQLFKKNENDLNWMVKNPWILSSPKKDALNSKYHFSSMEKSFHFYSLKIRNADNTIIGFMVLSKRNYSLKIPYLYHENCLDVIVEVLNKHFIKWKIKTFTTFHSELSKYILKTKTIALVKKTIQRKYMIPISLGGHFSNHTGVEIQDGDGDCGFT